MGFAPPRQPTARCQHRQQCAPNRIRPRPTATVASLTPTTLCASSDFGNYLQALPPFIPPKQVGGAFALAALTGVFLTLTRMLMRRLVSAATTKNRSNDKKHQRLVDRRSLQATYLLANGLFAVVGIVVLIPLVKSGIWQSSTSALSRAQGHVALGAFGSTQAGYGVWSIVTDSDTPRLARFDKLDEGTLMLIHHVIIVLVGMLVATMQLGFRAYAPFFCGISELSSIPLVTMKALARGRKKGYAASRLAFAISFLSVRVVAWLVFMRLYLRDLLQLLSSLTSVTRMGSAMAFPVSATFPLLVLTLLQLNWAYVIFKNLSKMVRNNNGEGD